ncbi:MAG: hypothetical protein OEZ43_05750 [Gammaproteobacteria bacterium]|nr:hypothetical protein [Gammaproteobacteria bacterium]
MNRGGIYVVLMTAFFFILQMSFEIYFIGNEEFERTNNSEYKVGIQQLFVGLLIFIFSSRWMWKTWDTDDGSGIFAFIVIPMFLYTPLVSIPGITRMWRSYDADPLYYKVWISWGLVILLLAILFSLEWFALRVKNVLNGNAFRDTPLRSSHTSLHQILERKKNKNDQGQKQLEKLGEEVDGELPDDFNLYDGKQSQPSGHFDIALYHCQKCGCDLILRCHSCNNNFGFYTDGHGLFYCSHCKNELKYACNNFDRNHTLSLKKLLVIPSSSYLKRLHDYLVEVREEIESHGDQGYKSALLNQGELYKSLSWILMVMHYPSDNLKYFYSMGSFWQELLKDTKQTLRVMFYLGAPVVLYLYVLYMLTFPEI